jgi:3-dehydroquinate synthase
MSDRLEVRSHDRSYTVELGVDHVSALQQYLGAEEILLVDPNVLGSHARLRELVGSRDPLLVRASEAVKSYEGLVPLLDELVRRRVTRQHRLVAIGGGVVQDATGFLASILHRGLRWVFFPTTLLAQCDSCIGSKTSINFREYKNQIGTFFPPEAIQIDLTFLATLPETELRSGFGEMLHYYLVSGEADFARIEAALPNALASREGLQPLVLRSLEIKRAVVERDEFDRGERALFNYGHSFGHALEAASDHAIAHGIGVAYGMDLANLLSAARGLIPMALRNRIRQTLSRIWSSTPIPALDPARFWDGLLHDKKGRAGSIQIVLTAGPGRMLSVPLLAGDEERKQINAFFEERLYQVDR